MNDLVFSYIADIDQELVVMQGISAQVTRVRQQHCSASRRRRSLAVPAKMIPRTATPALATLSTTSVSPYKAIPMAVKSTRPRKDYRNGSSAPSSIPLRMLLPRGQQQQQHEYVSLQHADTAPVGCLLTPPMSPSCMSVGSRTSSINPRFSDAHIEYVGKDCVIHNGAHIVDIAMEYASQRAAPRLVSFPNYV
ncbi:hypothetical protein COEREDRAFT_83509 [Coemansia reversa NRRL 1564]|uniref:Uncharacterized protein n=1 Tax=Coemansia reversa (strain ATCC 12441 / NRRL 1564) TaxID=763665 RepID=A0A2G5B317_COERN|nr:hypothetical protein COEREDRAFT_83509 [Coemansia reversa NRRL 1564]|eukprot:PIA13394.1 hypothetical protein COEREDRAFT_83509 [Coemansia reversa NRRL 1564]